MRMRGAGDRGRFDGLVELAGAAVPAAAVAFAAVALAPALALDAGAVMAGGSSLTFALAFAAMRLVPPEPRRHELALFSVDPIEALPELLLDVVCEEPLLLEDVYERVEDVLVLDDQLPVAEGGSRVVQLFGGPMPTPGELKARIDRHLAGGERTRSLGETPVPDASDALFAALAELRRSLR